MTASRRSCGWLIVLAVLLGVAIALILGHGTQRLPVNDDDMEVIRTVLVDWIDDPHSLGDGCSEDRAAPLVVFSPTFAYLSGGQIRFDSEPRKLPDELIQSFLLRNAVQKDLQNVKSNARIRITNGSPKSLRESFGECYPDARG